MLSSNVQTTFRDLGFVVLPIELSTSESLANLIKAASQVKYPTMEFRFFAFYFVGHGLVDANGDFFIHNMASHGQLTPTKGIIDSVADLSIPYKIFLFEWYWRDGPMHRTSEYNLLHFSYPGVLVAYAQSNRREAFGIWTRRLCANLRKQVPLVVAMRQADAEPRREGYQDAVSVSSVQYYINYDVTVGPSHKD